MYKYDLQPEKEHPTGEYLDNATKTEPDSIPNAQGYFYVLKNGYAKYHEQNYWSCLYGCKVKERDLQEMIRSWDLAVDKKLVI